MQSNDAKASHRDEQSPIAADDWLLWQLADSAFPIGGFGHSGGIEAAFQNGVLKTAGDLVEYLENVLVQIACGGLPFLSAAHRNPTDFETIDQACDAFVSNHVANRASRAQGQSFLASTARIFSVPAISRLREQVVEQELPCHFAPVFGAIACQFSLSLLQSGRLFFFGQLRGAISAAVRIGIIGPLQGQAIQARLAGKAERLLADSIHKDPDEAVQTMPLADLFQGTQDRLYSRLFQS